MRIRKNARRLVAEGTSPSTSFIVCKLNRSPWDDDSCFSQFMQDESDDSFPFTGSFADSIPISDSIPSGESMELSFEYIGKELPLSDKRGEDEEEKNEEGLIEAKSISSEVAKQGGHHLLKYISPPCPRPPPPRPRPKPASAPIPPLPKKRGRPKKHSFATQVDAAVVGVGGGGANDNSNNNDPNAYYYYSGFGPSWSKRRGDNGGSKSMSRRNYNSSAVKIGEKNGSRNSNASRVITIEDMDDDKIVSKNKVVSVVETVVDETLDYIDDDFDDTDDDDGGGLLPKRPRKPIKARSLKSLM